MNYYNEIDPKAAAWIAELIAVGLIPAGHVDTRSIADVQPEDLKGYTQAHFFCGISGWPLALRLAGFPDDQPVWTGSCPCQPFSCAGEGKGEADERHLWPAFFRLIDAIRPPLVFGEQVASAAALGWWDRVFDDLENAGYAATANDICAPGVEAPHLRQRLYWGAVGHANDARWGEQCRAVTVQSQQPSTELRGNAYRLACGDSDGRWADEPGRGQDRRATAGGCGEAQRLADSESGGLGADGSAPGATGHAEQCGQGGSLRVNWRDSVWIHCRDGKLRRVPSQPLFLGVADGLPVSLDAMRAESGFPLCRKEEIQGRTMLLRGYGNAICAPLAAEFIAAFIESL